MTKVTTPVKRFHLPKNEAVENNLKTQMERYMKKHGKKIRKDDLAALLLETAKLK